MYILYLFVPRCFLDYLWLLFVSQSQSQSHFSTNSQSVNTSWCQAHSWAFDQKFVFVRCFYWKLRSCLHWGAPSDERSGLSFVSLV
jgi:hypothetical protein